MDSPTAGVKAQKPVRERSLVAAPPSKGGEALAARFAAKLADTRQAVLSKPEKALAPAVPAEKAAAPSTPAVPNKPHVLARLLKRGERDEDAAQTAGQPASVVAAAMLRDVPLPAQAPAATADIAKHPVIDRIVAAIQDAQRGDVSAAVRVEFMPDRGAANGGSVTLLQDAQTGAFSIRLTGLVAPAKRMERAELETGLRRSLGQRRIRVDAVDWEDARADGAQPTTTGAITR